jgi:hypothetical protein
MDTSKSSERSEKYIGGASIYSGRPDPTWEVSQADAERLLNLWASMEGHKGAVPSAPVLGYRGCFLGDSTENNWFAYGGVVTLKLPEGSESRRDENRKFESLLLSTAPEGLIPPQVLDPELRI